MRILPAVLLGLFLAAPANADTASYLALLGDKDRKRIEAFDEALGGEAIGISASDLVGDWKCRTIKMGGLLPAVAYSFFKCRISERDGGLRFEKLSGSQRVSGRLMGLDERRWGFVGASHYGH